MPPLLPQADAAQEANVVFVFATAL